MDMSKFFLLNIYDEKDPSSSKSRKFICFFFRISLESGKIMMEIKLIEINIKEEDIEILIPKLASF